MPVWVWAVIALVVIVAIIAVVIGQRQARTRRLQSTFGPEYERAVAGGRDRREAEADLSGRLERRRSFDVRPLPAASRQLYADRWRAVQAQFVDHPVEAVGHSDLLVQEVMRERGYPMGDFEQRAADVSVDHPQEVEDYRTAHGIAMSVREGRATTEDLRRAMLHYRSLFERLLATGEAQPMEAR